MPQRLDISYRIQWDGEWHVGSGFRTAATDRLIQRLGGAGGRPFVPGSQIKGVLRHTCGRLAQSLGLDAIDPHATSRDQWRLLVEHFRPLKQSPLVVDRLFGSRFQGDCLFVDNAMPASAEGQGDQDQAETSGPDEAAGTREYPRVVRARTAMDRLTGTVKEGHLFTTELAQRVELVGRIRARHPDGVLTQYDGGFPYEYALLLAGLLSIDRLGGDKSSGLGRCHVTVERVIWNGAEKGLEECLAPLAEIAEFAPNELKQWFQEVRAEG